MHLPGQDAHRLARFHHLAAFQHGDAIRHVGDHGKVVRDQQEPHAVLRHEAPEQFEDLLLQHDVERCGRLVGDQQLRLECAGDGDDDALALAAGKLVRIARQRKFRRRQADAIEHAAGALLRVGAVGPGVPAYALGHLLADGLDRVERRHRFLEDHADIVAAQRAHPVFGRGQDVDPVEGHAARGSRGLRQELHDGKRRHRLARTGFADQRDRLPGRDRQLHAPEDGLAADVQPQAFDFEEACGRLHPRRRDFGSMMSEMPSPSRFSPSTVTAMAMPGKIAIHGAVAMRVCASNSMRPQLGIGGWAPRPT